MRLRGEAKYWLYGTALFYRGWFPYYGHQVYFPRRSVQLSMVCDQGIYEESTVRLVSSLAKPNSTYVDIGANIGLLSLPVLENCPDVSVISLEASPDTLSYLTRTQAGSRHRNRWNVMGIAVGKMAGTATFWSSTVDNGAFDGFRDTGRGGSKQAIEVAVKTLDKCGMTQAVLLCQRLKLTLKALSWMCQWVLYSFWHLSVRQSSSSGPASICQRINCRLMPCLPPAKVLVTRCTVTPPCV